MNTVKVYTENARLVAKSLTGPVNRTRVSRLLRLAFPGRTLYPLSGYHAPNSSFVCLFFNQQVLQTHVDLSPGAARVYAVYATSKQKNKNKTR